MVLEALAWGGYGWLTRDIALMGYGIITAIGSSLVLSRSMAPRPKVSRAPALAKT
jgi:hypothetical protein